MTVKQILNLGIPLACCSLFASGGKGFHIFIPIGLMVPGGVASVGINTARWWPRVCKAFVGYELIAECTDMTIYSGRSGRLFRQPNVQRANGLYKVALHWTEYQNLTAASYKTICTGPRPLLAAREELAAAPDAVAAWLQAFKQTTKPKARSSTTRKSFLKLDSQGKMFSADKSRVERALKTLQKVNLDYLQWLRIGMALKSTGARDALEMWDQFSKGHHSYRNNDCVDRWDDFDTGAVTLGTLYLLASKGGAV